jgi:hypothetical protein
MQRRSPGSALSAIIITLIIAVLAGCGGGGGGDPVDPPTPPPPGPPPTAQIGPGPGPAADAIPTEPAISTVAARAASFATSPRADLARPAAIKRIDRFAGDIPDTEEELRSVLSDFTGWVTRQPNDAVSQAGLAAAIVATGVYNAGIDAGYAPDQILSLLQPVSRVASAGLRDEPMTAAGALVTAATEFPRPTDPDFSSANLQIGIRKFLLPAVSHARQRLDALADAATGPDARLAEIPTSDGTQYAYRADVRAVGAVFRIGHAFLLQFCAYQFNPGDWDWTVPLAERDEDGDGDLSVEEYLPGDPFLWRHQSPNMLYSGRALSGGLATLADTVEAAPADSLLAQAVRTDGAAATAQKLRDLREMVDGEVWVRIRHEGGSEGPGSFPTRIDLSRLWEAPIDDLKTLFPTMRPVSGSAWEALPRDPSDFPRPKLGGVFPQPQPVLEMLTTGPTYITVAHGSTDPIVILDRRDVR